jgi:hypothetical protein
MNNTTTVNTNSNTLPTNYNDLTYDELQALDEAVQAAKKSKKTVSLADLKKQQEQAEGLIETYRNKKVTIDEQIKAQTANLKALKSKILKMNDSKRTYTQVVNPSNPTQTYSTGGYNKYPWLIELAVESGVDTKNKAALKQFVWSLRSK